MLFLPLQTLFFIIMKEVRVPHLFLIRELMPLNDSFKIVYLLTEDFKDPNSLGRGVIWGKGLTIFFATFSGGPASTTPSLSIYHSLNLIIGLSWLALVFLETWIKEEGLLGSLLFGLRITNTSCLLNSFGKRTSHGRKGWLIFRENWGTEQASFRWHLLT